MIAKTRGFRGSYRFRNFESPPQERLTQAAIPSTVTIILIQGFSDEVSCLVQPGDAVKAGQIIGRDDDSISSPVHASVNGKVVNVGKLAYLGNEVAAVTIESDGTDGWQALEGHTAQWESLSAEQIEKLVYLSGAAGAGRSGIPTRFKSSIISCGDVEYVIIHGVESEMYGPLAAALLAGERLGQFAEGVRILKKMLPSAGFHVALNAERQDLISRVSGTLASYGVEVRCLEPRYPADYDEVLVSTVLGRTVPPGHLAANIGVIVLDIQDVLHVYDAVTKGKPVIERTVALCGPGFSENPHVQVRIGAPLEHLAAGKLRQDRAYRLLRNSALTGERLEMKQPVDRNCDAVIAVHENDSREMFAFVRPGPRKDSYTPTFLSAILGKKLTKRAETNLHGEERPCINCGFCEEVCPAGLIPHHLFHYVERNIIDETLLRFKIYDCIDCNLCAYVCPSKIALGRHIREGKDKLINEGLTCPRPDSLKGLLTDSK
ncbi:MAG TPA: 4Fe-4S dicluster domain-containing protein [Anaerohalosphaeraceae bacterium]|jgi:electron transport complex protein RnfC|nr:4Fe-4S dicluster domain-containing protein [Anaerohalosphaeraceae bacterium]HRT49339.1 4Fe-4S dicluster domain-containing protein [Anaerohalosphaeraceae bacterium]HRT85932.1 4Fe-4S dicluster domain-containing protein [Anaerohalosphaeraceae bacterium]